MTKLGDNIFKKVKVSLVDVVDCFVLLCQFLIRPVWRKISIYGINLNFIIQKSKLRRNYRDEIENKDPEI